MSLEVAAAVSEHPVPAHAVGSCLGELLEAGGPGPVALVIAVTEPLVGALDDVVAAARRLLGPEVLLAVTVEGVIGGAREVDRSVAVMMFAAWDHRGGEVPIRPVRLTTRRSPDGPRTDGLDELRGATGTLVLFTDPFSVDADALLEDLALVAPGLVVVGGELSAARHGGGNRLVLDAATWHDGAVGLLFGVEQASTPLLSFAGRAIGPSVTVTDVSPPGPTDDVTVLAGLGGRPARECLDELLAALAPELASLAVDGLFVGLVRRPSGEVPVERFALLGGDADTGGLVVGGRVPTGSTVRFEVRDPSVVEPELVTQAMSASSHGAGSFVVLSALRGARFHGRPDAEAGAVVEAVGPAPVAGVVVGREFVPVAGRSRRRSSSLVVLPVG